MRKGKIKIQDILACSFLDDLLEVGEGKLLNTFHAHWLQWLSALSSSLVALLQIDDSAEFPKVIILNRIISIPKHYLCF